MQRVPSQNVGLSRQFSTVYKNHTFLAGFEMNDIRGSSNEIGFFGGNATSSLGTGGRERNYGIYIQDFARIAEKLTLVGSLRFDSWENSSALSSTSSIFHKCNNNKRFSKQNSKCFQSKRFNFV